MQQESKKVRKYLIVKVIFLFWAMLLSLIGIKNKSHAQAIEIETAEQIAQDTSNLHYLPLGTVSNKENYYKVSVLKPGKICVKITDLPNGKKVRSMLCDSDKNSISEEKVIKSKDTVVIYYVKKKGNYYVKLVSNMEKTINAKYAFISEKDQGGKSFEKATMINTGSKKMGIFGFDTEVSDKQYYKIKVDKEELVKLQFTKNESFSNTDTLRVDVYKSNNKSTPITWGWIFENQSKGTLYIRNSENHKTKKGTYYIVVSKVYDTSGFTYSVKRE